MKEKGTYTIDEVEKMLEVYGKYRSEESSRVRRYDSYFMAVNDAARKCAKFIPRNLIDKLDVLILPSQLGAEFKSKKLASFEQFFNRLNKK
jgi:hypothetical protein